ncbi:MAG: SDR family NAD(P)-dependent oxidoreductase, partial [Dehalococcoidia bacterium]
MRLQDKVAVITGATFGIGRATALLFAREGAKVVVAGRTAEAGEAVVKSIEGEGGQAVFVKTDVSVARDVKNMISIAVNTYGRLDVLFNNAGIGNQGK